MLTIRTEQMAAFQHMAEEQFTDRLVQYIRDAEPTAGPPLTTESLRTMVANGMRRARRHGLQTQSSIAAFVALMFQLGPTFDTWPRFAAVLDNPGIHPDDRLDVLAEEATEADLNGVAGNYDITAWFAA